MKNKNILLVAIVSWALVLVVLLGAFAVALLGKGNGILGGVRNMFGFSSSGNVELIAQQSFSVDDLTAFEATSRYQVIEVRVVQGNTIEVRQYGDPSIDDPMTVTNTGGRASVRIPETRISVNISIWSGTPRLEIDIPEQYAGDVTLSASSGRIELQNDVTWNNVHISTSSGTISANAISANDVVLNASSGRISTSRIDAASADISANSGTLDISDVRLSGKLTLNTSSGAIRLGNVSAGSLAAGASSGSITSNVLNITDSARVSTTSGTIRLDGLHCTDYEVTTSSGSVHLSALSGSGLVQTTSGSVTISALSVKGNSNIRTSSGSVHVSFAPSQNCAVQISTSSGSIRGGQYALTYNDQHGHDAQCKVGTGAGNSLTISTSSGSVTLS